MRTRDFVIALAIHGVARVCELLDGRIYSMGRVISGHSLKHFLSAIAAGWILYVIGRPSQTFWKGATGKIGRAHV